VIEVFKANRETGDIVTGKLLVRLPNYEQNILRESKLIEQTRVELLTELQDSLDPLKGEFDLLAEYNKNEVPIYEETGN